MKTPDKTPTHQIPSGLGGIFRVHVIQTLPSDRVRVRVHNPQYRGWHGKEYIVPQSELSPL